MKAPFEILTHPSGASLSRVRRAHLPSGVTLIVKEMPHSPAAYVSIWCQTGTAHEDPRWAGISHFLEHMFFKGTERFGPGEMDRIIKGVGGDNNAATSLEYTSYYAVVPAESYRTAFEVLADALLHSTFDPVELDLERQVVLEEIARKEDDPESKVFLELQLGIGDGTPYGRSVLGTPEALAIIDRDAIQSYLETRYSAPNLCVVVTGDVQGEAVLAAAAELLSGVPSGSPNRIAPFAWQPVPGQERRFERDVNQTYLTIGLRTPGLADLDLGYDLEVLATVLGEGRASRFVRRLREELGLVTSISAWTWDLTAGGMFVISASLEPRHEERVREEIARIIGDVREQPIDARELERALTMSIADFRMSSATAADVGETLGYAYVTTGIEEALRYVERVRTVDVQRLQAAARAWLDLDTAVFATVGPDASAAGAAAAANAAGSSAAATAPELDIFSPAMDTDEEDDA